MRSICAILAQGSDWLPGESSPELRLHAFRVAFSDRPLRCWRDPEGTRMTDNHGGPACAPVADGFGLTLSQLPTRLANWQAALGPDAGGGVEAQDPRWPLTRRSESCRHLRRN